MGDLPFFGNNKWQQTALYFSFHVLVLFAVFPLQGQQIHPKQPG
jgi:hypothetical protein